MRILRKPETAKKVGLSVPHIMRMEREGKFPRRVRLNGGRAVGFAEHEVDNWIAERLVERDAGAEK